MDNQSDSLLLLRLKRGDLQALEAVYKRHRPALLAKAVFMLRDNAAAADLVQALFIELWENAIYLQIEENLGGYLFRAVHNRCLNALKARKLQQERESRHQAGYVDREEAPEIEVGLDKGLVARLLGQLTPQKREVVTLVVLEDRKYQEAADIMGLSINTVKTHLRLALQQLREAMKNQSNTSPDSGG